MFTKEKLIWTVLTTPWTFGAFGSPSKLIGFIEMTSNLELIDIGKGFWAYKILSPKGVLHLAESESGAFIGTSIEEVKEDIASCESIVIMKKQIEKVIESKGAQIYLQEEFWDLKFESILKETKTL